MGDARAEARRCIPDVLSALEGDVPVTLISAVESLRWSGWIANHFPIASWGRVLWPQVPDRICAQWSTREEAAEVLDRVCARFSLGDPDVIVIWGNALSSGLALPLPIVRRHAALILAADFDTWILCPVDGWCIESYHEGDLCFGRAPSAP